MSFFSFFFFSFPPTDFVLSECFLLPLQVFQNGESFSLHGCLERTGDTRVIDRAYNLAPQTVIYANVRLTVIVGFFFFTSQLHDNAHFAL